ncbi:MAG: preprotein translocase subunit SecE [Desulfobulbaceae bacterium]|jgi:preprotein translocase subunit SecE
MASKKKTSTGKGLPEKGEGDTQEKITFSPARIREFFREVQVEFNKIVWPDRKVTTGLTGFVLILVIVISIYLGSVDLLLGKIVTMVLR